MKESCASECDSVISSKKPRPTGEEEKQIRFSIVQFYYDEISGLGRASGFQIGDFLVGPRITFIMIPFTQNMIVNLMMSNSWDMNTARTVSLMHVVGSFQKKETTEMQAGVSEEILCIGNFLC